MRCGVLGSLEVRQDDGTLLAVPGAKERLLLAVLAAAYPEVVTVDQLHEALWDGAPPPSVRKSLQVHVARLRGALEPDRPAGSPGRYVTRRQRGYALVVSRDRLDATAFEDDVARGRALLAAGDPAGARSLLTRALGRWRGTPYTDWPDVPALATVRARLEGIHAHAIEAHWETELALGRHVEAIPELERLVAEQPLHEHAWALLALALYRSGRQGDALDAVRRARGELRDSLGVDPGPELRELEQAVLAQDPDLVAPAGHPTGAPSPVRPPEATTSACPYKGLTRYEADDAALFRGRDRLVDALVVTLVDHEVLVVSGSSGVGKSSLVRAGLIPALAAGAVPGSEHWEPVVVVPGPAPVDDLAHLMGGQLPDRPVVLVCDQLEQLWSSATPPEERSAFLDTVIGLVEDGVAARCVLVVRGDHVGLLAEQADLAQRIAGGGLALVTGMSELELREVVTGPAEAAGLRVEPDLVDVAVREVVGRPGSLPLLSTALAQTWARRRDSTLSLAAYLASGGVAGAVGRSAEQVYSSFTEAQREQARAVLVRLAEQGPDGSVLARRLPVAELEAAGADAAGSEMAGVVRTLVDHRLVTRDGDWLEVAHESLLSAWPRLASWLEDDAVGRAVRRHLAPAALEWEQHGRPNDELYRGARLAAAVEWLSGPDAMATEVERAFVEAGQGLAESELRAARERAAVEAAGRRRTRRLAGVLAAALVLAVGSAVVAVISQQRADEEATVADANRLAALSSSARSLDLSLLLAVAAVRTADTPATRDSLLEALVEHRRATGVFDLSIGRLQEMALSEDGRTLAAAVGGASSFILVWEPGSGEPPRPVAPGLVPDSLTISPDGKMLVGTLPVDGEALKAFRSSGEEVKVPNTFAALGGAPRDVEFTESGRLMMFTSGARGKVQRFDLERGVVTPLLPIGRSGGSDAPLNAAFTDDASAVVVWSSDHRRAYWSRVPAGPPVRLAVQPRAATSLEFIATRTGALQLWSDGTVTRYDVQGRAAQELTGHRAPVRDAVLLPDGRGAVTAGAGGQVELWSVEDSGEWSLGESLAGHAGAAEQVEVSPDGQSVLTAARDGEVITWDVSGVGGFGTAYPGLTDRFVSNRVQVVEPGRLVVAPARSRPARPKPRALTPGLAFDHGPGTGSVAAVFWDPRDGRVVDEVRVGRTIPGYIFGSSVAVSPDRRWVAITSGFATTVLDAHTRERLARFPMPQGKLEFATCVAWTPDGSQLLIGSQGLFNRRAGMMVVDTERWELTRQVVGRVSYQVLEWAADGQTLAAGVNFQGRVHVYDAELRNVRSVDLGAGGDAWDLAFSPDGSMLAAARDGGGVTVVDTRSWRLVHETAPMHADHAVDVEWLPDGNTVVSTGVDEVASLYDVDRDLVRADPLPAAEVRDRGLTFLLPPTGEEIVVLNQDGPGRRYPLDPARWLADACEVAGRDLTPAEWDRYLPDEPYRPVCEVNVGKQSVPR